MTHTIPNLPELAKNARPLINALIAAGRSPDFAYGEPKRFTWLVPGAARDLVALLDRMARYAEQAQEAEQGKGKAKGDA